MTAPHSCIQGASCGVVLSILLLVGNRSLGGRSDAGTATGGPIVTESIQVTDDLGNVVVEISKEGIVVAGEDRMLDFMVAAQRSKKGKAVTHIAASGLSMYGAWTNPDEPDSVTLEPRFGLNIWDEMGKRTVVAGGEVTVVKTGERMIKLTPRGLNQFGH